MHCGAGPPEACGTQCEKTTRARSVQGGAASRLGSGPPVRALGLWSFFVESFDRTLSGILGSQASQRPSSFVLHLDALSETSQGLGSEASPGSGALPGDLLGPRPLSSISPAWSPWKVVFQLRDSPKCLIFCSGLCRPRSSEVHNTPA